MLRLKGKAAFVTGGGGGIGRGVALALAADGATVAIVDIDKVAANRTAEETSGEGRGLPYECDVSHRQAVHDTMKQFVSEAGGLDILVNNAVFFHYSPLVETTEAMATKIIDVGLKGALWSLQAATPHLVARGSGCIINLSSLVTYVGLKYSAVYTCIKGALDALTRQQAVELGPYGIRVNAIAPGPVYTPGARSLIDGKGWEARKVLAPLRRIATVEDIGAAAVFLASDDARTISGVTLKIDAAITLAYSP
jgi:NAD(P)-dependent dehydrogenase (short-subunit alcohol dehydrogenase family)